MTPEFAVTYRRVVLMAAIAEGQVVHHRTWRITTPDYDTFKTPRRASRRVTAAVAELRAAGLAELGGATGPSMYSSQVWQLTSIGREWLARAEKELS